MADIRRAAIVYNIKRLLFLVKELYVYLLIAAPVIFQLITLSFSQKAHDELNQFVESIHTAISRQDFDVKHVT
jgi:hypothetical protein